METDQFSDALIKDLRRDMNDLADTLASNRAKTIEDYRYTCGVLQGLGRAEEMIKALAKRVEDSDE
jgi:hypothetical protein